MTEHFLTLSIERNGHWFMLARYHDPDYDESGLRRWRNFWVLP